MKLIAFAGRKGSGKSELAKTCKRNGFDIIPFAFALKKLISDLVGFKVDSSQESKSKHVDLKLSKKQLEFISSETNIPFDNVNNIIGDITFGTVRDMLQIVGTNLIRECHPNWHVEKVKEIILSNPNKNWCIDDMRFPNEKEMVDELGGESWFVIRPILDEIYQHPSETSLKWQDFGNHIIINDGTIPNLLNRFEYYLQFCFITNYNFDNPILNNNNFNELRNFFINELESGFNNLNDKLIEIGKKYNIPPSYVRVMVNNLLIPYQLYMMNGKKDIDINQIEDKSTLKIKNGVLSQKIKNKRIEIESNPLLIENLKFKL